MLKLNTHDFIRKAVKVHGDKYDYSQCEYKGSKTQLVVICPSHGEFKQTPNNHLRSGGCNKCGYELISKNTTRSNETFIKLAKSAHGDKYDYTGTMYKSALAKVVIKCKIHGDFTVEANSHLKGAECRKCSLISQGIGRRSNSEEFTNKARSLHGDTYDYSTVDYITSCEGVNITCNIHGVFEQTPNDHLDGCGCPLCNVGGYKSNIEGYLYLMRSECGEHIKIGISNNIKKRTMELGRATPFAFNLIEYVKGDGNAIRLSEKILHSMFESSGFKGFDGCTEWFKFDESIFTQFKR